MKRPEILAPAGDREALAAAVAAGADAVYFGLPRFNARARATNFDEASLPATMAQLHRHGVKGYVTLNTLVFDAELPAIEAAIRACAEAGVDALIVQDLAVLQLAAAVAPSLPVHASTQMTCTDADAVAFARSLGAARVILARELSVDEVSTISRGGETELEVFVHGALCVAYSGQCLTSEAIGGRSANRGACAQSCRLPYTLVVDGKDHPTGDRAFLLSPEDLEASALVPGLVEAGVSSLKIEGRLKGPGYVAATTRLYRNAVDAIFDTASKVDASLRRDALQMFTRGSGVGFLGGTDHQRLVEGNTSDHRGSTLGTSVRVQPMRGKAMVAVKLDAALARGDGVLFEGGFGNAGELGGRVWNLYVNSADVESARPGDEALVWLGPERDLGRVTAGRRVFLTHDPKAERRVLDSLERGAYRVSLDVTVSGAIDALPVFEALSSRGARARVVGDGPIVRAAGRSTDEAAMREKLGRLGDSPFTLGALTLKLEDGALVPPAVINRARRALVEALIADAHRVHATTDATHAELGATLAAPDRALPTPGLFVLCRNLAQAHAAVDAGATGIYLDFLELTGTGEAVRALRGRGPVHITVAPPRIRKPGEEKIEKYLASLSPDATLVRSLSALYSGRGAAAERIGDFSLNVTNRLSAATVLAHNLAAFTPGFDLDAAQLTALVESPVGPWAELVVHHPMPLFHMEHCVFARELSRGTTYKDCGRPCETHVVSLRDRAGMVHPLEADVGCRNTVFHAASQSAAGVVPAAQRAGVRRFRIELVREGADEVGRVVSAYRSLLSGQASPESVWRSLKAESHYGVVRGSLRVIA
ncbi:MAG: U32 family peptidase [Myxococcales bacterium]|nr:U32 family peptidase [Myxococcales bacterium]